MRSGADNGLMKGSVAMGLTHFDDGGSAVMVDISEKGTTQRTAVARGRITMNEPVFNAVAEGTAAKGDVLGVARVAGIMAAKRTSDLIPLCHPIATDACSLDFTSDAEGLSIEASCTVRTAGKTGVEMEALTGVSVALLTIYDMCKALDREMNIGDIRLCEKSGGKSGNFLGAR